MLRSFGPRGLKVRIRLSAPSTPAQKAAGVRGVSSGTLCSPGLLLSCDMLLIHYDSGVSDPGFSLVLSLAMLRLCSRASLSLPPLLSLCLSLSLCSSFRGFFSLWKRERIPFRNKNNSGNGAARPGPHALEIIR